MKPTSTPIIKKCQSVKFLNHQKPVRLKFAMSKKFSKIFKGMQARTANGSQIKLFARTLYHPLPSRTKSSAQATSKSAFDKKNSVIFAALGINPFMCANRRSEGVCAFASVETSKNDPNVQHDKITNTGIPYLKISEQHFLL